MESIYGSCADKLPIVLDQVVKQIEDTQRQYKEETGYKLYEHLNARVKEEESMREKCDRKELPQTPDTALRQLQDAIGLRIVCGFRDDIFTIVEAIRSWDNATIVKEKDYITSAKPNGYRSYHLILDYETDQEDIEGNVPGHYFVEIQLRTIAMDSWAALEHQLKYKKNPTGATALIIEELKRTADELASCDLNMQTIRDLIRHENSKQEEE